MFDVVGLGELLIDFTYYAKSKSGLRLFEQNPGGAPSNVLCALQSLGMKTAFIGKVGADMHGEFLRDVLKERGVDIRGLVMANDVFTTLAFVELSENGERKFSFARKPGADTCLTVGELKPELLESCKIFHIGSLSLTNEPARAATYEAAKTAKRAGAIISYDPNYRAPLWSSREEAITQMRGVLDLTDIIKISDEETELLTGKSAPEDAAAILLEQGISCVVVTLGKQGAYAATKSAAAFAPAPIGPVVDTTGAGDAFWGGFLYMLIKHGTRPAALSKPELEEYAGFANKVATLCVGKRGGIPAMPSLSEVLSM